MIFVNINTPRINNARRVKLLYKQMCGDSYIIILFVSDKNFYCDNLYKQNRLRGLKYL